MSALHLVYQHWFITAILVVVTTAGIANIVRAFTGHKDEE